MEQIKKETSIEYLERLKKVAKTLTNEQVEACAWVMGGSGAGWNPTNIELALDKDITRFSNLSGLDN